MEKLECEAGRCRIRVWAEKGVIFPFRRRSPKAGTSRKTYRVGNCGALVPVDDDKIPGVQTRVREGNSLGFVIPVLGAAVRGGVPSSGTNTRLVLASLICFTVRKRLQNSHKPRSVAAVNIQTLRPLEGVQTLFNFMYVAAALPFLSPFLVLHCTGGWPNTAAWPKGSHVRDEKEGRVGHGIRNLTFISRAAVRTKAAASTSE
ncbi:hypothetical protein O3P69_003591 [Scylla paramamosain]|uniref:Uncharacterized protein n=1 Tax=Scylla paramamosain TaxID=85552 RepID=A0AAW0UNC2_SCYPA